MYFPNLLYKIIINFTIFFVKIYFPNVMLMGGHTGGSGPPCLVSPRLPGLPLPASVQNLFQKMEVFLIVPKRWFMTVPGGVV